MPRQNTQIKTSFEDQTAGLITFGDFSNPDWYIMNTYPSIILQAVRENILLVPGFKPTTFSQAKPGRLVCVFNVCGMLIVREFMSGKTVLPTDFPIFLFLFSTHKPSLGNFPVWACFVCSKYYSNNLNLQLLYVNFALIILWSFGALGR